MPPSNLGGRELDIASLIALWIAIHGGDPSPSEVRVEDETAILIAAALDRHLTTIMQEAGREDPTTTHLEERLKSVRIELVDAKNDELRGDDPPACYLFQAYDINPKSANYGKRIGGPIRVCGRPLAM
jgi:hypothetical protein